MTRQPQLSRNNQSDNKFLTDPPAEIDHLLKWFHAGAKAGECGTDLETFTNAFLGALVQDQAIIPPMNVYPPKLLAWVLTHHVRNPQNCAAWLNLGFALRLIAKLDVESRRQTRLQQAVECFDRSIAAAQSSAPALIRAWVGKALVFGQLGKFERAVQCSREALELDSSDPNLWLLQSSLLSMADRKEEALELIQQAYNAYLKAGEPEELRHLFDTVTSVKPRENC
jgi:tetratricopeptide (TPR) repeat protein